MRPKIKNYHDASITKWHALNGNLYIEYQCIDGEAGTLIFNNCSNFNDIIKKLEKGMDDKCETYQPEIIGFGKGKHKMIELDTDVGLLEIHCTSINET